MPLVPNSFPRIPPTTYRLACVGEAPGADEETVGSPFVGASGRFLRAILSANNIACDQTFFGNICQHRPPRNDIESFAFYGPEISHGLERLRSDLSSFRPHCVLLLGRFTFRAFHPDLCYPTKRGFVIPLMDWRGSIRRSEGFGVKTVTAYHPAFVLRAYSESPLFKLDVARGVRQSSFPEIRSLPRQKILRPSVDQVLAYLSWFKETRSLLTWDIEGFADDVGITMLSIAKSPTDAIVIPFWLDGQNYFSLEDELIIWRVLSDVLADPSIPKCAHNVFYELFVSAWRHRLIVNNIRDDTMMKHWELFPEAGGDPDDNDIGKKKRQGIGRDLGTCCSIYTEHPYYKAGRTSSSTETKLDYNATDSLITSEIASVAETRLLSVPESYRHYRFNINLIPANNYIMLRGCRLDVDRARGLAAEVQGEIATLQEEIDSSVLSAAVADGITTRKRKSDPHTFNVESGNQLRWLLFTHLALKPSARHVTAKGFPQTSEDVLLHHWTKSRNPLLRLIIRLVRKHTRLGDIRKLLPDADGRIRSAFDPVGTNTGRLSSRKSTALRLINGEWRNTGTNLQNVTKDLRVCFIPDSLDFLFWQVDLSGADAWTVAADLASLGYTTMLDDMLNGIKPALMLYHMLQEHSAGRDPGIVNQLPRDELRIRLKETKLLISSLEGKSDAHGRPLDWQYLCCKRVQHGSNYGAAPQRISEVVFGDSDGTIDLSARDAALYQHFYKLRYQTDHRNEAIRRRLRESGALRAACGIRRQFFNIRNRYQIDDAIVREAAAFEPQANTTYATNRALERLWYDPHNRQTSGALFVEPMLQIHDALAGQFPSSSRDWATEKLRDWFNNPFRICGTLINIPAEGGVGPNWKDTKESFL